MMNADLSPEKREEAIFSLHRYLDAIVRIAERLQEEGKLDKVIREISREKRKRKNK